MKFSIIIPARNGIEYLPSCVETIVSQSYGDYELILSDDDSTDGTSEFVDRARGGNVRALHAPRRMSMAEHWEWALGHARGEWLAFVGQDDGLMPYYFELAEQLADRAERRGLEVVASRRAYYFWPGCEATYGDIAVNYSARSRAVEKDLRWMAVKALAGSIDYFEIPSMYTSSLFRKEVLARARRRQGGALFTTHPQDANLAAIGCAVARKCLFSEIPLGWVGSSPKSAGLAVTDAKDRAALDARANYLDSVRGSGLPLNPRIGDFAIGSTVLYFWGALLSTKEARRSRLVDRLLESRLVARAVSCSASVELRPRSDRLAPDRRRMLEEALRANGIGGRNALAAGAFAVRALKRLIRAVDRVAAALRRGGGFRPRGTSADSCFVFRKRSEYPSMTLGEAQGAIRTAFRIGRCE